MYYYYYYLKIMQKLKEGKIKAKNNVKEGEKNDEKKSRIQVIIKR